MIRVLFFAKIKSDLSKDYFDLEIDTPVNVSAVRNSLMSEFSDQRSLFQSEYSLCAVNQSIANDDTVINASDEVAFFPPVTGG